MTFLSWSVVPKTTLPTTLTPHHCSAEEHPAGCNVSSLRDGSRGRLKRLNANTKSGSGGRKRAMFQYGSCDRFISSALRAAPATPSAQKARFNLFMCRLLACNVVEVLKLLSRQSRAMSLRCSTYSKLLLVQPRLLTSTCTKQPNGSISLFVYYRLSHTRVVCMDQERQERERERRLIHAGSHPRKTEHKTYSVLCSRTDQLNSQPEHVTVTFGEITPTPSVGVTLQH